MRKIILTDIAIIVAAIVVVLVLVAALTSTSSITSGSTTRASVAPGYPYKVIARVRSRQHVAGADVF